MRFKNNSHKRRFMDAIKKMDQKDDTQMSVVFLVTADKLLWNAVFIWSTIKFLFTA